jgi:putative hemolysin
VTPSSFEYKAKVNKMTKKNSVVGLVLAVGALGTLGACEHYPQERSGRGVGLLRMPNPASVYCVKKGGELKMEMTDKGQVGYCHLPDGRVIEEWVLFRQDNPRQGS